MPRFKSPDIVADPRKPNVEPSRSDAMALAYALRRRGVIVLAFGEKGFAGSSFGVSRKDNVEMDALLKRIGDLLLDGTIERD